MSTHDKERRQEVNEKAKKVVKKLFDKVSWRASVLAVLGSITVGVALLSIAVTYQILTPRFGAWSAPTVGAMDLLWVVLQATEILAANNRRRARRVKWVGAALTVLLAAIPAADLALNSDGDSGGLAVVIAPVAIVLTKTAWWFVLPSLGRKVSPATREAIARKRQEHADRLEQMEANAADHIEFLEVSSTLEKQISEAQNEYQLTALKAQQRTAEKLHKQALKTATTISAKPLPDAVAHIEVPTLDNWKPTAPAPPLTAETARHILGTQAKALEGPRPGTSRGTPVTLAELAVVARVPLPEPGGELTDTQLGLVLRHLRYSNDPPRSYRQAVKAFRRAGFVGSEERVRRMWSELMDAEKDAPGQAPTDTETDEETEDADRV